jgi:hypothetical protein
MCQRDSGYKRKERDEYETPPWVTLALVPHLPEINGVVWEPACGSGKMVAALRQAGFDVIGSDIADGADFLRQPAKSGIGAIITNPPYALAREFIERALSFASVRVVAMRTDFDHAATRAHLFAGCPTFAKKVVLTRRIRWFEDSHGSPSFNHCWMIWDRQHRGPPTLALTPAASPKMHAWPWLAAGPRTSATQLFVHRPRNDSAEAAGAFSWLAAFGARLTAKTHWRTRQRQCGSLSARRQEVAALGLR